MWIFGRKGESGYSASSTAEEVTQGIDGTGLTAIVTGASSGIGVETVRVLALRGVHVVMAVRNLEAGRKVRDNIVKEVSNEKIDVMELDLSSLASVRKFALEYKSLAFPLNILINNAGVFLPKIMFSKDNLELHFATNHLGHFLLTNLLVDTMKTTASQSQVEGRIINVASMAQNYLFLNDIQFDKTSNNPLFEYAKSKLANVLCANELGRRLKDEGVGITVNSLHPGMIPTNIFRDRGFLSDLLIPMVSWIIKAFLKNVHQGAATTCYVALHPQVKGVTGKYFVDCNLAEAGSSSSDTQLAQKLWDLSLCLTTTTDHPP